eukprot:39430_1
MRREIKNSNLCIIIGSADNNLSENRENLSKLCKHFALLYSTIQMQELYTEQDREQNIYINLQSSKYTTTPLPTPPTSASYSPTSNTFIHHTIGDPSNFTINNPY